MASSSYVLKYPPRLYEEGKSPLQHRSMNHNCFRSKIGMLKEGLGFDVWDELKKSSLGVFIKFAELKFTWSAQIVHFFLTHQLGVNNIHEIWSLIDGRPLRFSLHEFAHITSLNCDPVDPSDNFDGDHKEFWEDMKIGTTSDGPMFTELQKVFDFSSTWSKEKRMMVGRLCLLSICVHGLHHGSRIPLSSAKRVLDPVSFEKYPWGRIAFSCLVDSVKIVDYDKESYTIRGFVQAMLVWVYESVHGIGELFGMRRSVLSGVPILDWESCRKRIKFPEFIAKEKESHGQVRVRHILPVSEDNMYPKWCDADDNKDPDLDILINDIIHNRLPVNAWEGDKTGCETKKKRKVKDDEHGENRTRAKKNKIEEAHCTDEEEAKDAKEKIRKEHMKDVEDEKKNLSSIFEMMATMNGTISDLGKNLSSRMDALEGKFEAFVDQKMSALEDKLSEKIEAVDKALKEIKDSKPTVVPKDATSQKEEDDEAQSKAPSWIVEMNQTSQDEFPVQRVVKKVYTVSNKKKKETDISVDLPLNDKKVFTKAPKKETMDKVADTVEKDTVEKDNVVKDTVEKLAKKCTVAQVAKKCALKDEKKKAKVVGNSPKIKKKKKKTTEPVIGAEDIPEPVVEDVEDITEQVVAANTKMASSSEDTWDDPQQQMTSKRLGASLAGLCRAMQALDGGAPQGRRVPHLAESQKYPYVGNSTVKRIITDAIPSNVVYDIFQPAEDEKFQKLTDFLQLDKEEPLYTTNPDVRFYWQIMTSRLDWPTGDYGWLKDHHIVHAMTMFRKRFMLHPNMFPNQRIAFLDQDLITSLLRDWPQFEPSHKNFLFRDYYVNHFNGVSPIGPSTNKKWFIDVDNLYACLHVNGNHWVALDINLVAKKIYIYDSIPSLVRDNQMVLQCMFLRRMIPALLSQEIDDEVVRKKSYAMLEVRRVKANVPLNEDPGDCGVFALKYIECLSLGKPFDGLCDRNIPAIRVKLATELFDEVGEEYKHHIPQSRGLGKEFVIPHLTDSP